MEFIEGNTIVLVKIHDTQTLSLEGTFSSVADQLWALCENLPIESYVIYGGIELSMDPGSQHKTLVIPKIPEGTQQEMQKLSQDNPEILAQIRLAQWLNMMSS